MIYNSRNWQALEVPDMTGNEATLRVSGEVEVTKSNEQPVIGKVHPQGPDKTVLLLDVTVDGSTEIGAEILVWKEAAFTCPVYVGQYAAVTLGGDVAATTLEVQKVQS